ncbi:MAG: hypothetical protein RBU37_02435 [Myxococcota bacterium]|nr:hypothetical protein [Myxococcota bacterium]
MLNRWGWLLLLGLAAVGCNTFEDLGDYRYDQSKVDVDTDSGCVHDKSVRPGITM